MRRLTLLLVLALVAVTATACPHHRPSPWRVATAPPTTEAPWFPGDLDAAQDECSWWLVGEAEAVEPLAFGDPREADWLWTIRVVDAEGRSFSCAIGVNDDGSTWVESWEPN